MNEYKVAIDGITRGVLLTVGGTAEPVIHSLFATRPEIAVLVCSEETISTATAIKRAYKSAGLPQPTLRHLAILNPDDLIECHQKISEGLQLLRVEHRLSRDEIRIDFTGGTKAMSAAAVLAAAPDGYQFLYVSGTERTRDGIGTVVTGREKLVHSENPWKILEEPEIRRVLEYANVAQWRAALDCVRILLDRALERDKPLFKTLDGVLQGLYAWDRFDHRAAWKLWENGGLPGRLRDLSKVGGRALLIAFSEKVQGMIGSLRLVIESLARLQGKEKEMHPLVRGKKSKRESGQFGKKLLLKKKEMDPLVLDMLGNGNRKASRGNFDEAALLWYRALELFVDRRLHTFYEIDSSSVSPAQVPEALRKEIEQIYGRTSHFWKLGQKDSIRLLAAKGDSVGKMLERNYGQLDTTARNENWLIHGLQHVDERRFKSFRSKTLNALGIKDSEILVWPDFSP